MKSVHNSRVADIFDEIATMLDIEGENRFRILAYQKASQTIRDLPQELSEMLQEGRDLTELPGIGKDLSAKIEEIVKSGDLKFHKELQKKVPLSLVQLCALQNLGPKKVKKLHDKLRILTISDLEKAARAGKIEKLEGFGKRSEEKILEAIELRKTSSGRMPLVTALPIADSIVEYLKKLKGVNKVEVAGSIRRRKETIGDLDVLVTGNINPALIKDAQRFGDVDKVLASGETKVTLRLVQGIQVDIRFLEPKSFGSALNYFTGSKEHNVILRNIAKKKGLKLSEYGLFKGSRQVAGIDEEGIYKKLGLDYIPPVLREDRGEIDAAKNHKLPKLITLKDIRGDLHIHTTASDGSNSIIEMAREAKALGYEYIAITDHSHGQRQANGLEPRRMRKHLEEIRKVNDSFKGLEIFAGSEVDILKDGSLDYKDDLLDEMDVVVASIHSHFLLSKPEQTKRVIKAIKSGRVTIIGHPTARLLGRRKPVDMDMDEVLKAAGDYGVAMECSAQPSRLDLSDLYCKLAKDLKVKVVINTDAHSTNNLHYMELGIYNADRGWIGKGDVINTLPLAKFKRFIRYGR